MSEEAQDLAVQIERLLDVERPAQAGRLLARLLALTPDDPDALFLAARVEYAQDRPKEARARIAEVLVDDPCHHGARLLLFLVELDTEHFAAAEETILGLLRDDPDDAYLLAQYARLMLRVLQLEKARALVTEALRRDPDLPLAQVLDALLEVIHRDHAGASARLAQLVSESPEAEHVARTAMVVLAAQGRHREVLEIGRGVLRAAPDDADLIEALVEARLASHWSMRPLWPFIKYGWGGSLVIWLGAVLMAKLLPGLIGGMATAAILSAYVGYVVYSWVWPPILRRILRRRGF